MTFLKGKNNPEMKNLSNMATDEGGYLAATERMQQLFPCLLIPLIPIIFTIFPVLFHLSR